MNCPNCELMRKVILGEIAKSSDPFTVHNLQTVLASIEPDPQQRGERPLFREV